MNVHCYSSLAAAAVKCRIELVSIYYYVVAHASFSGCSAVQRASQKSDAITNVTLNADNKRQTSIKI